METPGNLVHEVIEVEQVEIKPQSLPHYTGLDWYACKICSTKKYCSSCIIKRLMVETPGLSKRQYTKIEKQIAKDFQLMMASEKAEAKSAGE